MYKDWKASLYNAPGELSNKGLFYAALSVNVVVVAFVVLWSMVG